MDPARANTEHGVAFGKYTLIAKLATGGMGEIFLARLTSLGGFEKLVVIKRLLPHLAEDSHFVAMLLDEARIAARLSHPNVCQVYDLGEVNGQYYIAMEYLEGVPISRMLQETRKRDKVLDIRLAVALMQQSCEGLHHAHELADKSGEAIGLVHRDVSPSNLFVTLAGLVKVLDFGVAKSQDALARTHTGALKGKYAYMSPEQVLTNPIDRRSDVFSLGIVLFELLAARRLFWRESEYKMFQAIAEDPIPSVRDYRPDVPEEVDVIISRALSRDPVNRYPTAKSLADDLLSAIVPWGGPWTTSDVAAFVDHNFQTDIRERRELFATAAEARPTSETRAMLPSAQRTSLDTPSIEISLDRGEPTAREPIRAARPTRPFPPARSLGQRAWRLALVVLGVIAVGAGGAFAYVELIAPAAAPPPIPEVKVLAGAVQTDDDRIHAVSDEPVDGGGPQDRDTTHDGSAAGVRQPKARSIEEAVSYTQARFRKCINRHPSTWLGTLTIAFQVGSNGRAKSIVVSDAAVRESGLGKCLVQETRAVRFRKADAGARVKLPLRIARRPPRSD